MTSRYHATNLGTFAAGLPTDTEGYVHLTAAGWLAAPMDAAGGPMSRAQAEELAQRAVVATAEAEADLASWAQF
jgi:folate-dependent tRNA-U54 methylase TrmFO/GidA